MSDYGWDELLLLPHGQLVDFHAEQGHRSLVSKVPNGDYTGLVIH